MTLVPARQSNRDPERCDRGCRAPAVSRYIRLGDRWVCPHGAVWRLVGYEPNRRWWRRLRGFAAWQARRAAEKARAAPRGG